MNMTTRSQERHWRPATASMVAPSAESPEAQLRRIHAERERDSVTFRQRDAERRSTTTYRATEVEREVRARLSHWTTDEIESWVVPCARASLHYPYAPSPSLTSARARSSPRRYKPPPVPPSAPLRAAGAGGGEPEGAADAAVAAEERRRAAAAEAEVLRLSEELGGCQRELEHNRRLTAELRTALDQHHRSLAVHHRRQTVPPPNPPHLTPFLTAGSGGAGGGDPCAAVGGAYGAQCAPLAGAG